MKIAVTGATGLVGASITQLLLKKGYDVKVLVRETSPLQNIQNLSVEKFVGDIHNKQSLEDFLSDCQVLFHAAADYKIWGDKEAIIQSNVQGTTNILEAALTKNIDKIIYTSSIAAVGSGSMTHPADEQTAFDLYGLGGGYVESKYYAELKAFEYVRQGLPITIVNPGYVMGPGDIKPTPSGQILLDYLNKALPGYMDMYFNVCHVYDVAQGHLLAYEKGRIGERYILGGENISLERFLMLSEEVCGIPRPPVKFPYPLLYLSALGFEVYGQVTKTPPLINRASISMSKKPMCYRSDKAVQELGYVYRSAKETIIDAAQWFLNYGYVKNNQDSLRDNLNRYFQAV